MDASSKIVFDTLHDVALGMLIPPGLQTDAAVLIRKLTGHYLPDNWSWDWKVERGTYSGTMPTRIKAWVYKAYREKLDPQALADTGEKLKKLIPAQMKFHIDYTQKIDWPAGKFADGDSCFLTYKRKHSVPTIVKNGGFAMRRWEMKEDVARPDGRAWVFPCPYGYLLCNPRDRKGYRLSNYAAALGRDLGLEVSKLNAYNGDKDSSEYFYIDGSYYGDAECFIVGTEEQLVEARKLDRYDLNLKLYQELE